MGGSAWELIFLVVFGLVTLFQFVRNYLRRKAAEARQTQTTQAPRNTPAGAPALPPAEPLSTSWGRTVEDTAAPVGPPVPQPPQLPQPVRTPLRPRPTVAPSQRAPSAPRAAHADDTRYPARRARRFSRVALMGDRRAVQDAVVIAAILRPCHAHKPYGVDG